MNSVILEIRAGVGGNEAGLFASELFRMYKRFAESQGFGFTELSRQAGGIGNITEVVSQISANSPTSPDLYKLLKHEIGVHRVQRIPKTEKSGRIHTSTATVAVLPVVTAREVNLNPKDIKIEFYRSSSQGGQNVQKVSTAVRLTHLPTGVIATCQEERSQFQNRERAMGILLSRIYEMTQSRQKGRLDELRRGQVGSGDRTEKIRTYNYPQDRITDHRLNKSFHHIDAILDGHLLPLLQAFSLPATP